MVGRLLTQLETRKMDFSSQSDEVANMENRTIGSGERSAWGMGGGALRRRPLEPRCWFVQAPSYANWCWSLAGTSQSKACGYGVWLWEWPSKDPSNSVKSGSAF